MGGGVGSRERGQEHAEHARGRARTSAEARVFDLVRAGAVVDRSAQVTREQRAVDWRDEGRAQRELRDREQVGFGRVWSKGKTSAV